MENITKLQEAIQKKQDEKEVDEATEFIYELEEVICSAIEAELVTASDIVLFCESMKLRLMLE